MTTVATGAEPAPIELPTQRTYPFDPPLEMGRLREREPVCRLSFRSGDRGWLVTSHPLARAVLTDSRFSLTRKRMFPLDDPDKSVEIMKMIEDERLDIANMLTKDPPEHTRLRRLLAAQFSINQVARRRERIEQIVAAQLDAMEQAGPPADLVTAFAMPIASAVHCALLGVPESDSVELARFSEVNSDPNATVEAVIASLEELRNYVRRTVAWKRSEPADDLLSLIIAADELSEEEIVSVLLLLFSAGVDTVATMLATGPFALLSHPEQLAALRDDLDSIDGAVEELMRYLTIFKGTVPRVALEEVELGGQTIGAGDTVLVALEAANRDPAKFERPDELDVKRSARGHLGFGHGVHVCLGQHLARQEMQIAIGALLRRFPTLRLDVAPEQVPLAADEHVVFAARSVPVAW